MAAISQVAGHADLDSETSVRITRRLTSINSELKLDTPDRAIVERYIALIVSDLIGVCDAERAARDVLKALDAHPPQLVDAIAQGVGAVMNTISESWGAVEATPQQAVGPIREAGETAEHLRHDTTALVGEAKALRGRLREALSLAADSQGAITLSMQVGHIYVLLSDVLVEFWHYWAPIVF